MLAEINMSTNQKTRCKRRKGPKFHWNSKRRSNNERNRSCIAIWDSYNQWCLLRNQLQISGQKKDAKLAAILIKFWVQGHAMKTRIPNAHSTPATSSKSCMASKLGSDTSISSISTENMNDGDSLMSDVAVISSSAGENSRSSNTATLDFTSNYGLSSTGLTISINETNANDRDEDFDPEDYYYEDLSANLSLLVPSKMSLEQSRSTEVEEILGDPDENATACQEETTIGDFTDECCISYVEQLLELAKLSVPTVCSKCPSTVAAKITKVGTAVSIAWVCTSGHLQKKWDSQPLLRKMYLGNFLTSASIVLTGNNYSKVALLMKVLRLGVPNEHSHYKVQAHYVCPCVENFWQKQLNNTLNKYTGNCIVVIGDGRNDSPGFSAQYCVYTLMHHDTLDILAQVVVDKRETDFKSPNMERLGLRRALSSLAHTGVTIGEIVTDAHMQITAMLRKDYPEIQHSLDTWHGCKLFVKTLGEAAKKKGNEDLLPWVSPLANHFWYSCRNAQSDPFKLASAFHSCLKHITDVHVWAVGHCGHMTVKGISEDGSLVYEDQRTEEDKDQKYLKPGSNAVHAVQTIVTDSHFMKKFPKFANFRHTSSLEAYHNVVLMYASKRQAFGFEGFRTRHRLAALDWMQNKCRPQATSKDGNVIWHKNYRKATNSWCVEPKKVPKSYAHLDELIRDIIQCRRMDNQALKRPRPVSTDNPVNIAPNASKVPPPPKKTLVSMKERKSRFTD